MLGRGLGCSLHTPHTHFQQCPQIADTALALNWLRRITAGPIQTMISIRKNIPVRFSPSASGCSDLCYFNDLLAVTILSSRVDLILVVGLRQSGNVNR